MQYRQWRFPLRGRGIFRLLSCVALSSVLLAQVQSFANDIYRGSDLVGIVGSEVRQRASILCAIKDSVHPDVTAAELTAALGPLAGIHRLTAIRCLEPRLSSNLRGDDLALLVGEGLPQREAMLCAVKDQVRFGIASQELAIALGRLRGVQRLSAIRCLEPRIGFDLGGDDIKLIVGDGVQQADSMICAISGHFREDISANEITSALGELHEYDRLAAIRCIEKNEQLRRTKLYAAFWGNCGARGSSDVALGDYLCFATSGHVVPVPGPACAVTSIVELPLMSFQPVYFGAACEMHDSCYARPGARKSQCDTEFRSLLNATCDETLSGNDWGTARHTCRGSAEAADIGLKSRLGCKAFVNAQRSAGFDSPVCD